MREVGLSTEPAAEPDPISPLRAWGLGCVLGLSLQNGNLKSHSSS